jgi:PEP-CTERM motif
MKASVFSQLAPASPRVAVIAVAALTACGAAFASTPAQAGYSFETINDPADIPPPPGAGGLTFTNLMGITGNGDTIPGFYGSGQAGDPNTGFVLTLPGKTFTSSNATFPGLVPPFNAAQTQMTAVNGNGTTFTGYTYPTNTGVATDFQFGFYEKGGAFTMVNNPKTPDCSVSGACDTGVITENQLIGVNNKDLAVGFYNDTHGDSHGYTYDIATGTFSADINDPNAVSTVTAAINNSDEIAGFFTDSSGVVHGFIKDGSMFTTVDPLGATETQLLGLNDKGIADGFAVIGGVQHGILFDSLTDTFTILDPPGSTSTTLNGLNDAGDVVGFFVDATGNTDGTLGTPVPEPTTWLMILAGFAGLGCLGLRSSRRTQVARAAL